MNMDPFGLDFPSRSPGWRRPGVIRLFCRHEDRFSSPASTIGSTGRRWISKPRAAGCRRSGSLGTVRACWG